MKSRFVTFLILIYISVLKFSFSTDLVELVPSNQLNPLMDPLSLSGEYNQQRRAPIAKEKHIPDYMMGMFTLQKNTAGFPFEIARNYEALSGSETTFVDRIYQRNNLSIVHHFMFNVSTLPADERLEQVELKLWVVVHHLHGEMFGIRRLFRIYLMNGYNYNPWDLEILDFRIVIEPKKTWLTFNVTHAVRFWMQERIAVQALQLRIDPVHPSEGRFGSIDISQETPPQLVVYSSGYSQSIKDHDENDQDHKSIRSKRQTANTKHYRKSKQSPTCRRRPFYVNFTQINYDQWIIAPSGFEAYECVGRCDFPLSDHLTPSRHSIIKSLVHAANPEKVSRVCCVPVRLEPISLLYIDDQDILTFKYKYADMVVAECGCR